MKGGHAPIQIQRWAPYDYVNDPFVKRLYLERDFKTAAFYPMFLFQSFLEGGDLPADPRQLAAVLLMRVPDVAHALSVCVEAGKLYVKEGRVFHKRVMQEVVEELEYRENQAVSGRKGGRRPRKGYPKASLSGNQSPPSPSPLPLPPPNTLPSSADAPVAIAPAVVWSKEACSDWTAQFQGTAPGGRIGKALKPLVERLGWPTLRPAWRDYLAGKDSEFATPEDFAAKPGPWLNAATGKPPRPPPPSAKAIQSERRAALLAGVPLEVLNGGQRGSMEPRDVGAGATARARGIGPDGGHEGRGLPEGTPALPDGPRVDPRRE